MITLIEKVLEELMFIYYRIVIQIFENILETSNLLLLIRQGIASRHRRWFIYFILN